jgi:integrase
VLSRVFVGRYSLGRGLRIVTVSLDTPDEQVARKRLRDLIVEKQREAEGLEAPKQMREAFKIPLSELRTDYRCYLESRRLNKGYIRDTVRRLERMAEAIGWRTLADIRPDSFERWFSTLTTSAKTNREYQLSARAFLNWLVRMEQLERNPLAKIDLVSARGREVRPARAFTDDELRSLFSLDGERAMFYRALFYTGARVGDLRLLVWEDVTLKLDGLSIAPIRASTTKTRVARVVPLHPCFVRDLLRLKHGNNEPRGAVFAHVPSLKELLRDLSAAGIERRDSVGRVVHRHALRMTARTVAVRCGVSERVCDAVLGHTNANRMGTRYTDISGLPLHEWTKLPWFGRSVEPASNAQPDAQKEAWKQKISDLFAAFLESVNVTEKQPASEVKQAVENFSENGRGDRIRTYDLLVPNQALYQAKLHPEKAREDGV